MVEERDATVPLFGDANDHTWTPTVVAFAVVGEELKQEHDVISWRQKVLELAAARADRVDECGWDQRLIFDEEEYLEFGDGVLESYEERSPQLNGAAEESMQVDGACGHGEWWCRGKKKCQRHAGSVDILSWCSHFSSLTLGTGGRSFVLAKLSVI